MTIAYQGDVPYPFGALFTFGDPFVIAARSVRGDILFGNAGLARIYGDEALAGRRDDQYLSPDSAAEFSRRDADCLASGKARVDTDELALGTEIVRVASVRIPHVDASGAPIVLYAGIPVTADDSDALRLARQAIKRLELEVAYAERSASTDRLTGAFSRAYIDEQGRNELVRLRRYGHPVSIIFMDLDGLKATNDSAGHGAGDALLTRFTAITRSYCRDADRLARYGGDEFVLLLPNTPLDSAVIAARRLQGALLAQPADAAPRVAASFGVAEARTGEEWGSLIARADAAMYRAKRLRSNEIEVELNSASPTGDRVEGAFIELHWHARYDSGEPTIDRQHRSLFRQANSLVSAATDGRPREELVALLDVVVREVEVHFATEERVLAESGYRLAGEHAAAHARLLDTARRLVRDFVENGHEIRELVDFLVYELIARHMLKADRAFFPHLKSTGP